MIPVQLCICQHWSHEHSGTLNRPCGRPGCTCRDYFEVAKGSSHRYQTGQSVMPRATKALVTGDRFLGRLIDRQLQPVAIKRDSLVLTVVALRYAGPDRWSIVTDLGVTLPVLARSKVLTVNKV